MNAQPWIRFTPPANKLSGEDPDVTAFLNDEGLGVPASIPAQSFPFWRV
jgi:hypothetical protein